MKICGTEDKPLIADDVEEESEGTLSKSNGGSAFKFGSASFLESFAEAGYFFGRKISAVRQ